MRIVFAGTPDFSVPVLQALIDSSHSVVGVYTQPDRPAGRGRKLQASPVKQLAESCQLPVFQPKTLKSRSQQAVLAGLRPDLMVVVAYGLLLPQAVLDIPALGCVNLHASLLPRWRGAAPIQRSILAGDRETGVCLMQMEAGLDTGPVLDKMVCAIADDETGGSLHDRLSRMSAELLARDLDALAERALMPLRQDEAGACYANKLDKSEAVMDWGQSAIQLDRQVRAFNPWPVAQTTYQGDALRIWRALPVGGRVEQEPGGVVAASKQGIDVACGDGVLRLLEVQLPGGKRLSAGDFLNSRSVSGQRFGH